jgi:hypothetical protein
MMGTRSFQGFGDFTVLGSEIGRVGHTEWQVVLWSERDLTLRSCRVLDGTLDRELPRECIEAVQAAIYAWDGYHAA